MMIKIVVLPGDGIGPEVISSALRVLKAVHDKAGIKYEVTTGLVGGASIDKDGIPITDRVLQMCKEADAVLLGAIGGPEWDDLPLETRKQLEFTKHGL